MQRAKLYPRYNENLVLIAFAILLGTGTALLVRLFRVGLEVADEVFNRQLGAEGAIGGLFETLGLTPQLALLLTLPFAGLIVGLIVQFVVGREKYHGVAAIMESVAIAGGRLKYTLVPFKTLASIISLGAGASLGPEDPSVQIGANLGSWIGARFQSTDEQRKLLVAAGAASAISAAFNAPIAGVFFALEVILGEFTTTAFGAVVVASVMSSAVMQSMIGSNPVFGDLDYVLGHPIQLPFYALLGILMAGMSIIVIWFMDSQNSFWHKRVTLWLPLKTALTGLLVAIIGLFLPQILGTGEGFIHSVLTGHLDTSIWLLVIIGIAKLIMTAISQGGGFVGGVFAPTLFIGITLGSAYGRFFNELVSSVDIGNPQAYAIAGMAGLLAGVVRAPMTAILLVFELTDDYTLILPIMLTAITCTLIIEQTGPPGIYMWSLVKEGLYLHQGRDVDLMQGIKIKDAMLTPAPVISSQATMATLRRSFHDQNTRALCVVNQEHKLIGIVTLGDLQRTYDEIAQHDDFIIESKSIDVMSICTHDTIVVAPDDVLWTAIRLMGSHDIGRLPVVDRDGYAVGLLRRHDIMHAYNTAVVRKFHDQNYADQIRLNTLTGAHVIEFKVTAKSRVINKRIRDLALPQESLIASVARRGKLIIPHGDTILQAQDRVTVITEIESEPILATLFGIPSYSDDSGS